MVRRQGVACAVRKQEAVTIWLVIHVDGDVDTVWSTKAKAEARAATLTAGRLLTMVIIGYEVDFEGNTDD